MTICDLKLRAKPDRPTPEVLVVDGLVLHVTRKAIKNMYLRIKPPQGDIVVSHRCG